MELEDKIYEEILKLCDEGECLIENDKFNQAILKFNTALELIPLPKTNWEASLCIYTALGDSYFFIEDYEKAQDCFYNAMNCPEGISNPFVLLRVGQSVFECGDVTKARGFLLKAFMLEGDNIFEEEDEKYYKLIEDIV